MHIKLHYIILMLRHFIFYKDIQICAHNIYFSYIVYISLLLHLQWYFELSAFFFLLRIMAYMLLVTHTYPTLDMLSCSCYIT